MRVYKLADMVGGWFIGDFEPAVWKTAQFEVAYKTHSAGENWARHFQREAVEINLLVRGRMEVILNGKSVGIHPGDIFVIEKGIPAKPRFYSDCELVVVKIPSLPGNKVVYEVETETASH